MTAGCLYISGLKISLAAPDENLPTMMVGQTIVERSVDNKKQYGGLAGNFAVFNPDPNMHYGFNRTTGTYLDSLSCLLGKVIPGTTYCYKLGTGPNGADNAGTGRLMVSRTYVYPQGETTPLVSLEIPALFFGSNVVGDAYSGNDYLKNFAFWGRNLARNGSNASELEAAGVSWKLGSNYDLNPDAQSKWSPSDTKEFNQRIKDLADEATVLTENDLGLTVPTVNWYLQAKNAGCFTIATSVCNDSEKYPDGKVWVVNLESSQLKITKNITYKGKGTIIIKGGGTTAGTGGLSVGEGISITPATEADKLGIIVLKESP